MPASGPAYRRHGPGLIRARAEAAWELADPCRLCPRECGVRRRHGEAGVCRTAGRAVVSSYGPHFGEEPPLTGWRGSGTIFFAWCNLRCIYCQNYQISQEGEGREVGDLELAQMMLTLQQRGCHNVNLVSPSHVVPQILSALAIAAEQGLALPLVYNTGGYDAVSTLRLLDGIVDIYMPDMKYSDAEVGRRLSGVSDYPERNREAVREMHRQVGDLVMDQGLARRGLIVRHLILPRGLAGTEEVVRFLAEDISPRTYVNIMGQYRPCYRARETEELARPVTTKEYVAGLETARRAGLRLAG
ncbi:MAG: radical SAM protein [Bacillota bacterium]|nr:radical SAM protein [Bacillota bacterium]